MATARSDVSIPHARLEGGWDVLTETEEGSPAVAVRDDERSGVAFAYPRREDGTPGAVERVAVVVNVPGEYVLLAASFDALDAVDWLLARGEVSVDAVHRSEYDALSSRAVCERLDGNAVVVVDPGDGRHGALQLYGGLDPVRRTWTGRFPRLDERLFAVARVLAGVDLAELSRRAGPTGDRPSA
jgi:hypothetical protein